jgi:short-subunit dehydrogenase
VGGQDVQVEVLGRRRAISMGIGVDLAECFAHDGYDLILARSEEALRAVAGRLSNSYGVKAAVFAWAMEPAARNA